jgi:putative metal-binding protein
MILLKNMKYLLAVTTLILVLLGCDNTPQKTDNVGNLDPCAGLSAATRLSISDPLDPCYLGRAGNTETDDDDDIIQSDCYDNDGDGFSAGTQCPASIIIDCDDTDAAINPDADEIEGNDIDEDCRLLDMDEDGYDPVEAGGTDCDDANKYINPGATEIQGNPIDEDCSEITDTLHDADMDWYDSTEFGGPDCDDDNAAAHPGLIEICGNDVDEDCDGVLCTMFLTPADGSFNVPPNAIISITTSASFASGLNFEILLYREGIRIAGDYDIYNDRKALRFIPDVPLSFDTEYERYIRSDAEEHTAFFSTIPAPPDVERIMIDDNRNLDRPEVYKVEMLEIYKPTEFAENGISAGLVQEYFFGDIILGVSHIESANWTSGTFTLTHARPHYIFGDVRTYDAGETVYQYSAEVTGGSYFEMYQNHTYYEIANDEVLVDFVDISGEFFTPPGFNPSIINGRFKVWASSCLNICNSMLPACDFTCFLTCNSEEQALYIAFLAACGMSLSAPLEFDLDFRGDYRQLDSRQQSAPVLTGDGYGSAITMSVEFPALQSTTLDVPYSSTIYELGDYPTTSNYSELNLSSIYHQSSYFTQLTGCAQGFTPCDITGVDFVLPTEAQVNPSNEKWLIAGQRYDARLFFGPYTTIFPDILVIPEAEPVTP